MRDITFIQIGSNVGNTKGDPIHSLIINNGWRGVLIEPVPRLFELLKRNYSNYPNLYFENVAISDSRKTAKFYILDENSEFIKSHPTKGWGDQLGSFYPEVMLNSFPFLTENMLRTIDVPCVTLQDIVDRYQLEQIDLIQMDAEGHDHAILLSIDFKKIEPKIIIFEHVHMTLREYVECKTHLNTHGYTIVESSDINTMVSRI